MDGSAPAPTRRRENTRQRLLDAAASVFAEVGLDAASVEAVCDAAGYTRGAFYSNFASKEELFLDLAARVAEERVATVRNRVAELKTDGALARKPSTAARLIEQVLEVSFDDRSAVLLLNEIRMHALRNPDLATPFLAQDEELRRSVARIIDDIVDARGLELRLPSADAARLMILVWEGTMSRIVMDRATPAQAQRRMSEALGQTAQLLIVFEPRGD
jgi:AcrR family transcriptional regulator